MPPGYPAPVPEPSPKSGRHRSTFGGSGAPGDRRRSLGMARRWIRIGGVLVLASAVTAAGFAVTTARAKDPTPPVTQVSTGTAEVRRLDVAERQWVNGTLGHAGAYTIVASGPG